MITGGIITILILIVILFFTGQKSVHSEIIINSTANKVWDVLSDTDKYPEWNPVMLLKEGSILEGQKVVYQFTQSADKQYDISTSVKKVSTGKLLNQGGGMSGVLSFDHRYFLEKMGNKTKLIIHEDYRGIGVNFWNPKPVQTAYEKLALAIKNRAESI